MGFDPTLSTLVIAPTNYFSKGSFGDEHLHRSLGIKPKQ
jgi:hypothetical protein